MLDKIRGGFFGVAIGDAMGATVEFMSREEIKQKYGEVNDIIGGGWLNIKAGEVTDDTHMTIAVAEGILANPDDPIEEVGKRFVHWCDTSPRDVGNTCRRAIWQYKHTNDWHVAAQKTAAEFMNRTAANGTLMRTLPISFAYLNDYTKMADQAVAISRMTHWDDRCDTACVVYNYIAANLLNGMTKEDALAKAAQEAKGYFSKLTAGNQIVLEAVETFKDKTYYQLVNNGYVVDTLTSALWNFMNATTFEETVINVINLGDDADTVGAIAGGLAGVYYAYENIPLKWSEHVELIDQLDLISQKMVKID